MTRLDPEEAERQYNARAAIPDHPAIFERWRSRSVLARGQLRCEPDCYYGPTAAETIDLFPSRHAGSPLLLFIHGGYWRSLDKSDFSFVAPPFVVSGVTVAVVNHALAPAVSIEEIVGQILRACAWLWRNCMGFNADPRRIVLAGHSAGAHLAAMMLAADWPAYARDLPGELVAGALLVSGLYDLEPLIGAPFLRDDLRLDAAAARRLSPLSYKPRGVTPFSTAVGALESEEFHRQNREIARMWPDGFVRDVMMPGHNHLTVIEALADPASPLHEATLELLGGRPHATRA
jgi:arylformamidase